MLVDADAVEIGRVNEALAAVGGRRSIMDLCRRQILGFELLRCLPRHAKSRAAAALLFRGAERLAPALAFLETHLAEPFSRSDLARAVHLSPSRFFVLFKRTMGISPTAYVQEARLRKAQDLLLHSNLPVGEVGREVGWPDPHHFSRIFKKHCQCGPLAFRRARMSF